MGLNQRVEPSSMGPINNCWERKSAAREEARQTGYWVLRMAVTVNDVIVGRLQRCEVGSPVSLQDGDAQIMQHCAALLAANFQRRAAAAEIRVVAPAGVISHVCKSLRQQYGYAIHGCPYLGT